MVPIKLKSPAVRMFLVMVMSATIFSFTSNYGGDVFKIYVNKKLVLEQMVYKNEAVRTIQLNQSSADDEVEIYYSHCGTSGKGRNIVIKDGQNRLLKDWRFADAGIGMSIKVKDILALQKNKAGTELRLYYSSKEIPAGKLLTSINAVRNSTAKL